jgi:hypothetical protein
VVDLRALIRRHGSDGLLLLPGQLVRQASPLLELGPEAPTLGLAHLPMRASWASASLCAVPHIRFGGFGVCRSRRPARLVGRYTVSRRYQHGLGMGEDYIVTTAMRCTA